MKQITLSLIILLLAVTLVMAGTKRIETLQGSVTITLNGNDSTGFLKAFRPIQISEMAGGAPIWENHSWDQIVGSVIMPNLTPQNSDSVDGENAVDYLIARYKFVSNWYTIIAETDSCPLPCTTSFAIAKDIWADYTATTNVSTSGDSAYAYVTPVLTGDFSAFLMDQFYLEYFVSDTAGTNAVDSGQMSGELKWFFKFFEDE